MQVDFETALRVIAGGGAYTFNWVDENFAAEFGKAHVDAATFLANVALNQAEPSPPRTPEPSDG